MLNVHPFWSIGVSIALVEGLFPSRADIPWLGKLGDGVAGILFALGACANTAYSIRHYHFVASTGQFTAIGVFTVVFVVSAFLFPANVAHIRAGTTPSPSICGLATFLLGFAVFLAPVTLGWVAVAWILAVDVIFLVSLWVFSRRSAWTPLHTFSIGAAGALVYGVHAFMGNPVVPTPKATALLSHVLLLLLAFAVIALGVRRLRTIALPPPPGTSKVD